MKLYIVHTRKFRAYVIANDLNSAYEKFKNWLDTKDYGFYSDREFESIEEIADSEVTILYNGTTSFKDKLFLNE